ncbi:MAG: peptidoglycan DD-metalloendopeptidase family protein [Propionibacteriaceae bacterium]|nr:peptidoglycan DD-metalloendopeptidase family protein [Propionibacteriaceae bacterium]
MVRPRQVLLSAAIVAALTLGLGFVPPAQADQDPTISAEELRRELEALVEEQRELVEQKATAEGKYQAAQMQIAFTRSQMVGYQAAAEALREQITRIALQRYQDRGLDTTALLLTHSSRDSLLDYMAAMQQVTDTATAIFSSLRLTQGTLSDLQRQEEAAIEIIVAEQARIAELEATALEKADQVRARLDSMASLVASRSRSVDPDGRGVADPGKLIPNPSTTLAPPLASWVLTSPYGMRIHPFTGGLAFHEAVDMAIACGTPIFAPANGLVLDYYWTDSHGNRLVIDLGIIKDHHVVVSFSHLSGAVVKPGTAVLQGERVAMVGTTGHSTGCHLHYMMWMDGLIVDPTPYAGQPSGYGS